MSRETFWNQKKGDVKSSKIESCEKRYTETGRSNEKNFQ